jgi:MFS transporter, PPP family, 3-phenylpropionic acid transporter
MTGESKGRAGGAALPRLSAELRTSFYYLVTFTSTGAAVAYGGIWFAGHGLSSGQIGVINALPVLITLALNVIVGRIADRASDWRQVIVVGALLGAAIPFGLFFVGGFWGILVVWTCASLPVAVIGPVADAAALRLTKRNGSDFGVIRAWGTVGYMVLNALTGFLVSLLGSTIFVPLFVGLSVLRGLVALALPRFRAPAQASTLAAARPDAGATRLRQVMKPWFLLPLVAFAIIQGTHIILNAFAALLWKEQGIPEAIIGPLIALAAFAEAATMFAWKRIGARFSARNVILVSALVSSVRWAAMGFSPPVWVLVFLQLLQSLTFAMGYLGTVHFIARWTSEHIAAEVQSFFTMLQQVSSVIALAGFGWLIGIMGARGYLVAAVFALVAALCVWLSMRLRQPHPGVSAIAGSPPAKLGN